MNTTQLECFLAVADFLNFSRAAQHLRLTQPAVSHQVKTLEDELGVALFQRTSKQVRLTQEGHMFLQYAGKILQLSKLSQAQVKGCYQARPMRLGLGCRPPCVPPRCSLCKGKSSPPSRRRMCFSVRARRCSSPW